MPIDVTTVVESVEGVLTSTDGLNGRVWPMPSPSRTARCIANPSSGGAQSNRHVQSTWSSGVRTIIDRHDVTRGDHDELARRAGGGDMAALDALLELIDADGSIRIPVRQYLTNPQAIEDACQDVLIVVAEHVDTWDGRSSFKTWLATVASNKAIDYLRATTSVEELPVDVASDQRRMSSVIATRVEINKVVAGLPDHCRDAVVLRDIEQYDYDDIARMLDIPTAHVRMAVSRGRALVAARWARMNR